jgi:hypothetical protein
VNLGVYNKRGREVHVSYLFRQCSPPDPSNEKLKYNPKSNIETHNSPAK